VPTWLPVAASLAAGVLLFSPWAAGAAGRRMLRDVLGALRGVALPLLVVAIVGALTTPNPLLQVAVGLTASAIVVPWVREREWRQTFRPWRREAPVGLSDEAMRQQQHVVNAGLLSGLIAVVVFIVLLAALIPDFEGRGGLATALAVTAITLWVAATILRLVGFGSSWPRWIVAIAGIALLVRAILALGIVGITLKPGATPSLAATAAAFLLVAAGCVVWESTRAQRGRRFPSPAAPPRVTCWGLGFAVVSSVVMLMALGWGRLEVELASTTSTAGLPRASPHPANYDDFSDGQLALAFTPILFFDEAARWTPTAVDGFLAEANFEGEGSPRDPAAPHRTLDELPRACPGEKPDPCYVLTLGCPAADVDDEPCAPIREPGEGHLQNGAAYVRVVRKDEPRSDERDPFEAYGPRDIRSDLSTLVQYWFFYDYDEWIAPVLAGRLVQRHEGDWEAVTVGLAEDRPLFVAFSEHCGGVWQRWDPRGGGRSKVRVADTAAPGFAGDIGVFGTAARSAGVGPRTWDDARAQRSHPAVFVAQGSQANYPPALADRAPDWSTCHGIPHEAVSLLSYVSNIRDRTGKDLTWMPSRLLLVDIETPPMTFPGTWGAKDTIQYVTTHDDPDVKGGRGPRTPSRQELWLRPVHRIFCGPAWRGDGERRDLSCES
jgi:hypothetical protein